MEHRVESERVVVKYRNKDGIEQEATAPFLIDASGLTNFTANRESLRSYYSGHRKIAIFGHFRGVEMPKGEEEGDIIIVRREKSWCWLIPLTTEKTSVGLVLDSNDFKGLGKRPQEVFDDIIANTPALQKRFKTAEMIDELHVISDFSYKNDRLVSPRIVRVGDSSGFIDPMFSSGVLLAMASGQQGAQAIHSSLDGTVALTSAMKRYEKDNRKRIAIYWEFIENFYKVHFAQLFFQPYNRWRVVCSVNAVLAGRTDLSFAVWWRLRVFFLLAWLNERLPLAAKIKIS
jgi:flavin-dependent dehydrogenase